MLRPSIIGQSIFAKKCNVASFGSALRFARLLCPCFGTGDCDGIVRNNRCSRVNRRFGQYRLPFATFSWDSDSCVIRMAISNVKRESSLFGRTEFTRESQRLRSDADFAVKCRLRTCDDFDAV